MRTITGWLSLGAALIAVLLMTSIPIAAAVPPAPSQPPAPALGGRPQHVDCADAIAHGVEMQSNLRAGLIRVQCGLEQPGDSQRPRRGGGGKLGRTRRTPTAGRTWTSSCRTARTRR